MVFFLAIWPSRWRRSSSDRSRKKKNQMQAIPSFSKDIPEVKGMEVSSSRSRILDRSLSFDASSSGSRIAKYSSTNFQATKLSSDYNLEGSSSSEFTVSRGNNSSQDLINLGSGSCYSLSDLQLATDDFSEYNIVGEGGYGVVYKGRIPDGTLVAVKCLTNKGQAHEFAVEVETIGRVRHKNLVRLFGFCAEGDQRMLVYEYMNNGTLEQWLHGPASKVQTPNWDARMKVILGTARGLAYLHEALEPKIIHRDIKASNILLDTRWNAKVADFGLAKLLVGESTHVMTRVMGTFGYVAPEYASTGLLNERSDVYSFGVLLVEVVTGREPVDYSRSAGEVNLVDWLKVMLSTRRLDEIADPRLEEKPSPRALKKALITALQCVHPDAAKRPTMGHIVHTLEAESFHMPDKWKNAKGSGLSKLVESQKQHQTNHNFVKELPDFARPRRQRYEA